MKSDNRFDSMRSSWIKFGSFWLLQTLSICIIASPVIIMLDQSSDISSLKMYPILGMVFWLIGFSLEVISDYQKARFKKQHPDLLFTKGIFNWVQFPNYLGEILIWIGIWIYGVEVYNGWMWIGVISPIWIFVLLRYISGIPLIEESRNKKYGNDAAYLNYVKNTNRLFPI